MIRDNARTQRAILCLNGFYDRRCPDFYANSLRREGAFVVCADGAIRLFLWLNRALDAPLWPSLLIGDLDSLDPADRERCDAAGVRVEDRSEDQDHTDGEKALDAALDAGCAAVDAHGAFPDPNGYDHDHFLGNLFLMRRAHERGAVMRFMEPYEAAHLCTKSLTLARRGPGLNRVSFLPFGGEGHVSWSVGLRWPMRDVVLSTTRANALRNEFLPDEARVVVTLGPESAPVLVIHNWYAPDATETHA